MCIRDRIACSTKVFDMCRAPLAQTFEMREHCLCHVALWFVVLMIFMFCWLTVWYYGMLQIVLDPLSRFENHTHQAILASAI